MAEIIIRRPAAIAQGLKLYFTGKPCKHGHVSERRTETRVCVECTHVFHAKWYQANREEKLEKNKQYLKEHPEANRRAALKWRNQNLDKARQTASDWYASNPEKRRLLARQKREKKPLVYAVHQHTRRARKLDAGGTHTASDLLEILTAQNHRCAYCRADLRKTAKHVDHIQPLSGGGSNHRNNLQYLCEPCNLSKGAKSPLTFAQELGRLL